MYDIMYRRLPKTLLIALVIAVLGAALPAVLVLADNKPQSAVVFFNDALDPAALPAGLAIVTWSSHSAVFYGVNAETSRALYSAGALLVFPIRQSGCIALRS